MAAERRVHLVTGAARGMGAAVARRFCALGPVVIVDLRVDDLGGVEQVLADTGAQVTAVAGDIREPATIEAIVAALTATDLPLGGVVHAAGLSPTMADWRVVLDVNLVGSARLMAGIDPLVVDGTAVVLFASQAAYMGDYAAHPAVDAVLDDPLHDEFWARVDEVAAGVVDQNGYGWSKHAVQRMAVRHARAWGGRGARVVSLSPGIIATPMGRQELEQQPIMTSIIEMTPLQQRQGRADEVAAVAEFLCSPAASFISAVDILVDGGSTAAIVEVMGGS